MAKKIAFVFSEKDLSKINPSQFKIFATGEEMKAYLFKKNIKYWRLEDYFPKRMAVGLYSLSGRLAVKFTKLFLPSFSCLTLSLHNFLAKKLFLVSAIDNLISTENPAEVFLGEETGAIARLVRANFEEISPVVRLVCKKRGLKPIGGFSFENWLFKFLLLFLFSTKFKNFRIKRNGRGIVLFASHHYHTLNIINLIRKINRQKKLRAVMVGKMDGTYKSLKNIGLNYYDLSSDAPYEHIARMVFWKIRMLLGIFNIAPKLHIRFASYDLTGILAPKVISLLLYDAPGLIAQKLFFKNLLEKLDPKILVSVTNDSSIQTLIGVAQEKMIPTLEIQHGINFGGDIAYSKADKLAVWGEISRKIFKKAGVDDRKMVVCGWPAFEVYKSAKTKIQSTRGKQVLAISFLAQDPEGMSVLFMRKTPEENLETFFKAMSKLSAEVKVIVRLHPRADKNFPLVLAKKYNVGFQLSENESLLKLLERTDIVVGQTTSATVDAIIAGKPVVYLHSMSWPEKFLEGTGAAFVVDDAKNLEKVIRKIKLEGMSDKMIVSQRKFIEKYCNFSQNAIDLISKQINKMVYAKS